VVHAVGVVGGGVAPDRDARAAIHPDRYWSGHGDPLAAPARGAVIRDGVVLGGPVVRVSPPTGGITTACNSVNAGGRSTKVTSVCQ
jgi:hypothetical protein